MGRIKSKTEYQSIRNARIQQIQEQFDSLGVKKAFFGLRSVKPVRKWQKIDYGLSHARRSPRFHQTAPPKNGYLEESKEEETKRGQLSIIRFKEQKIELEINELCQETAASPTTTNDYESIRNARIQENQERFDSLGVKKALFGLRPVMIVRKWQKIGYGSAPARRSPRLNQTPPHNNGILEDSKEEESKSGLSSIIRVKEQNDDLDINERCLEATGSPTAHNDYESMRNARIQENQARLALLGVQKAISDLRSMNSSERPVKKIKKIEFNKSPLRRSSRLKTTTNNRILELNEQSEEEWENKRHAKVSSVKSMVIWKEGLSPDIVARRCSSKNRGTVYHAAGISCHFCRQKTLCSEEDCKHCGELDMDQPCIGKTECSVCHSGTGVLCRACLKVRYGEEMEVVRDNKEWMCPHCIEDKGIKPYWICNSSLCLKKRKLAPTGIAIFKAREMGFKSVAHYMMEQLQRTKRRC